MNLTETARVLAVLKAGFPEWKPLDETPLFWQMVLDDVPYEAVMLAVAEHAKWGKPFPPKPTELRRIVAEKLLGLPSPEDAWLMVGQRIGDAYFPDKAPEWGAPKPVQDAVKVIGGIRGVQMNGTAGDMRRQFVATYEAYRERALREADLPALWAERQAALAAGADNVRALPAKEQSA